MTMSHPFSGRKILYGDTLKIIACITMLLDHIAVGIITPVINSGIYDADTFSKLNAAHTILRAVGRNAFPIYCFLLVEGFTHTSSRLKYAIRLLLFGILSEPIYDITIKSQKAYFNINPIEVIRINSTYIGDSSNVFFTLFIGFITLLVIEKIQASSFDKAFKWAMIFLYSACFAGAAGIIRCSYKGYGVILIIILYLLKTRPPLNLIGGCCMESYMEKTCFAIPAFVLIYFYNGQKSRNTSHSKLKKFIFYAFYPGHLLLIYLTRCILYG